MKNSFTQAELDSLPEVKDKVLWQPDDSAPTIVVDFYGYKWSIGFFEGRLSKRLMSEGLSKRP